MVLCALLLCVQVVSLFAPIVGEHDWRQSDTYSVARNFYRVSSDFFHPRIDWNHGRSGVMGMEMPIYPYLVFLAMYPLGEHPRTARIVAWLLFFGGAMATFRMLQRRDAGLAVGFVIFAVFSPFIFFEARQIQPDGPSMGLLLTAAAAFHRFSETGRKRSYLLGLIAYTAAVLMKPPALFAGPAMWLFAWTSRPASLGAIARRGLLFAIPLGAHFGWSAWSEHLNTVYEGGRAYFATRVDWAEVKADLTNAPELKYVFGFLLPSYAVNWTLFPLVGVGAVVSFSKRRRRISVPFWAWLLFGLLYCWLFARRFHSHWYYAAAVVPPILFFGALGLAALFHCLRPEAPTAGGRWLFVFTAGALLAAPFLGGEWASGTQVVGASGPVPDKTWVSWRGLWLAIGIAVAAGLYASLVRRWWPRAALSVVVIALAAFAARGGHDLLEVFAHRARTGLWRTFDEDWSGLRRAVDCHSSDEERIVGDFPNPWALHLAQRSGFAERPRADLEHYRRHGVRLFVHFKGRAALIQPLARQAPLAENSKWAVYCLDRAGCDRRPGCK